MIELNKIYYLDMGYSSPTKIVTHKFKLDGVLCTVKSRTMSLIPYDVFEMNGYSQPTHQDTDTEV